jgi:hypothetical protein
MVVVTAVWAAHMWQTRVATHSLVALQVAPYRKKKDVGKLPTTLAMVVELFCQATPTITSFPAVVEDARAQVWEAALEEA